MARYLKNDKLLERKYKELKKFSAKQERKIDQILKRHQIKENPLYFFNKLTYWREHRKKVNLMGFHVLEKILLVIEKETGISLEYLKYLTFEEVDIALSGLISIETLKKRKEKGMFIDILKEGYKIIEGREAKSLIEEIEQKMQGKGEDQQIIYGKTASQGYAKGKARVVLDKKDFHKLKDGDILVTGMTRPEFVPIMKKAAGIVTNEGGVTCHAAIVSRELGKPCVIGTKFATDVIKDGKTIEVRANHGTVRVLQ